MFDASDQGICARLDELDTLDTVSSFCRAFYRLMARLLIAIPLVEPVRLALAGLIDVELRHHGELKRLAAQEEVSIADLRTAGERRRIGLQTVLDYANRMAPTDVFATVVQQLVAAECNYHLRRTADVIAALERVVELGVDQPLVQFALGYNRYVLALEMYTEPSEHEDEVVVVDPLSFQVQCLQAVSALEEGLYEGEFDIQLYWWMGVILDAAGLTEAAQDAYDKSVVRLAAKHDSEADDDVEPPDAKEDAAITEAEVRMASELLKGRFDRSEIMGLGPDDCS